MEKELTKRGPVLDQKGRPVPGYSTKSILQYDRKAIKAPPWRIKEWDFYQINNQNLCLQFTIGHASYAGQVSVMLFDFQKGERLIDKNNLLALPFGSLHMPADAESPHKVIYNKKGIKMKFETKGKNRILTCIWDEFEAKIRLKRKNPNSLVINVPFDESEHCFYYNHKINCMEAEGLVKINGKEFLFKPEDSYGLLDWGRGVWPFHNEWYWSNGTGLAEGELFGFNLGCGFGNTSQASENMLFYQGKAHKIGRVRFRLGKDYMEPWILYDDAGRLELTLTPSYDRFTKTKALWVNNFCHQVFGRFNGRAVLGDGTELKVENIAAFAEYANNNW